MALRQLAVILVGHEEWQAVADIATRIPNRAERRTIEIALEDALAIDSDNAGARDLLLAIYRDVRPPQRRDLREGADRRGIDVDWPDVLDES